MAEMPPKTASGTSHERFGINITTTVRSHLMLNKRLTEPVRDALAVEADTVGGCTQRLGEANRPYQSWLKSALVETRAIQRVGDFLCDEAQRDAVALARRYPKQIAQALAGGVGSLWTEKQPSRVMRLGRASTVDANRHTARQLSLVDPVQLPGVAEVIEALESSANDLHAANEQARAIAGERVPLKFAVDKAIVELRGEIDLMKARLTIAGASDELIDSLFPVRNDGQGSDPADEDEDEEPEI